MGNCKNKTLRRKPERNEESCETESRLPIVPVVVQPVPVQNHVVAVLVEIRDVEVAIAVPHVLCKMPPTSPPLEYSLG